MKEGRRGSNHKTLYKAAFTFLREDSAESTDVHRSPASSLSMLTKSIRGSLAASFAEGSLSLIFLLERSPGDEVDSCCHSSSTGPN